MNGAEIIFEHLPTARRILRVAVVTETYPPEINGVAMTIARMVAGLQQRQHQVQLVRPRQGLQDSAASEPTFEEVLARGVAIPRYDSLIFAGMRTGEDLAAHYASGDVFLFPSTTETFGNVTVEAMASGLAVIAYDYAAAAEFIEHGRNGVVADFENTHEFVELAAKLINDAQRIAGFGRRARETAEHIDWEYVHDEFESALLDVIAAHDRAIDHEARLSA